MDLFPQGVAIVYIDNSNIFINTQKHSARLKGYLPKIQDVCCRIDIGKLVDLACEGKQVLCGKLYGSEPPALDTVWKAIRRKEIEVHTCKKSFASKEKETDTSLTADAVEDCVQYSADKVGTLRTFILFSGDRDMLPVVQKAEKYGWNVHVWAFKNSLSDGIARECRQNQCVQIFFIDSVFHEITFCETEWSLRVPRERSLVLIFSDSPGVWKKPAKDAFIHKVIDTSSRLFSLPTRGLFLTDRHFAVVVCLEEKYTKSGDKRSTYDFTDHVWSKAKFLKNNLENCVEFQTYINFLQYRDPNLNDLDVDDEHLPDEIELEDNASLNPEDYFDINFQPVKQKTKKNHTRYSEHCMYRFWCKNGIQCRYTHSPEEKEYFKKNPQIGPMQRYRYKSRFCTLAYCDYRDRPYLCPFAHDVKEVRCLRCLEIGLHWTDECPLNQ
ncbi:unnamed protein product [Allacma fusca]|uniref:NYN domain-containing protein n=1 Tax=Allacma fusca TaxID=39272 RepID=A0A8J2PJK4_9HEXA|nr:unnamed protein product [Allacma fusca]